jgi:hypothetical protein
LPLGFLFDAFKHLFEKFCLRGYTHVIKIVSLLAINRDIRENCPLIHEKKISEKLRFWPVFINSEIQTIYAFLDYQ